VSQRTLSQHPARKIPVVYLPALPDNSLTFQLPMAASDDDEPRSIRLSLLHDDSPWHQTQTGEVDADGRLVVGFDGLPKKGAFTLVTLPDGQAVDPIILFRGKSVEEIRKSYPSEEGSA